MHAMANHIFSMCLLDEQRRPWQKLKPQPAEIKINDDPSISRSRFIASATFVAKNKGQGPRLAQLRLLNEPICLLRIKDAPPLNKSDVLNITLPFYLNYLTPAGGPEMIE